MVANAYLGSALVAALDRDYTSIGSGAPGEWVLARRELDSVTDAPVPARLRPPKAKPVMRNNKSSEPAADRSRGRRVVVNERPTGGQFCFSDRGDAFACLQDKPFRRTLSDGPEADLF